jgi:cystathionine beta-lyase
MEFDFDRVHPRTNTRSIKWDFFYQEGQLRQRPAAFEPSAPGGLIPMWLADMDFRSPQSLIDALATRLQHGILGYTMPTASYYEAIAGWMRRRHRWQVQPAWIVTSPGVMQSISLMIQTFTRPGDGVIIQPPVFNPFATTVEYNGRVLVRNPLRLEEGRYVMDFEDLSHKAAGPEVKMIILCSPHNPVGRVWRPDELRRLGEICEANDILVVSDEIHADIVYSWGSFTTFGALGARFCDRLLLCTGASKSFNLPGLRSSITLIPNEALRRQFLLALRNLNELFGVNALGTLALEIAFQQGEAWLQQMLAYLEENYLFLQAYLEHHLPQLKIVPPEGLYLIWLDCRPLGLASADLAGWLHKEAGVLLEPGDKYGPEGEGFLRMNIACPRVTLVSALDRISKTMPG